MSELLLVFPLQTLSDGGNVLLRSFYEFFQVPHGGLAMVDALNLFLMLMLRIFVFVFGGHC